MFTPEQIEKILEEAKPSIIESFKREIAQNIGYDLREKVMKLVSQEVVKWTQENILPEVFKQLVESKEGMISVGAKLGPQIVDVLVASLVKTFSEKMNQSWDRKRILEEIFKQ